MPNAPVRRIATALAALLAIVVAVVMLERPRAGLAIETRAIGTTPATLYRMPDGTGPVVVVAHGFAGSRQIMQAYTLSLAQAGYRVLAFDFEGHGRNPVPMSGDVTAVEGTTALLVAETRRVIAAARTLPGSPPVALLGHSMATDILVRAGIAEEAAGRPVAALVAVSMFSQAVTATEPERLLIVSGEWEGFLRSAALDAVHLVDPGAREGETGVRGAVTRRAVVAPGVEHVGVLYSATAVRAARDWLDAAFGRGSTAPIARPGPWILLLLTGIVVAFRPVAALLPAGPAAPVLSLRRFLAVAIVPAVAVPFLIVPVYDNFLPVLVADYLMLHLAGLGLIQIALTGGVRRPSGAFPGMAVLALAFWGIAVFGVALDRHAASFVPTIERLPVIAALAIGTVPFMIADARATEGGGAALWRRILLRAMLIVSLGIAAALDPQELTFVVIILPVLVLFFLVHGVLGRRVARRSGPLAAGIGLGLCLAYALGVSFPLFRPA